MPVIVIPPITATRTVPFCPGGLCGLPHPDKTIAMANTAMNVFFIMDSFVRYRSNASDRNSSTRTNKRPAKDPATRMTARVTAWSRSCSKPR